MIAAWALILGGVARIVGEVLEVLAGQHTGPSGIVTGIGLVLAAIGFTGLLRDAGESVLARAGVFLIISGALAFGGIAIWSVSRGTMPIGEVAQTVPFALAALVTLAGALALAAWLIATPHYPRWIGIVMTASIGLSLVSSFVALPSLVQPIIDMVMALTFIQLGLTMAERRKAKLKSQ